MARIYDIKKGLINESIHVDDEQITLERSQDVAPIIHMVKERRETAKGKDMYYIGSIPLLDYYRIQREAKGDRDKEAQLIRMFFQSNSKFSTGIKGV